MGEKYLKSSRSQRFLEAPRLVPKVLFPSFSLKRLLSLWFVPLGVISSLQNATPGFYSSSGLAFIYAWPLSLACFIIQTANQQKPMFPVISLKCSAKLETDKRRSGRISKTEKEPDCVPLSPFSS